MPLSEIFSTSFFVSLAIILFFIGIVFIYINYQVSQQDHKMSSMLGLISTMAQELDYFRSKLHNYSNDVGNMSMSMPMPNNNVNHFPFKQSLIEVSDDDEQDEDEDDEDEDDDDEDDDDDDEDEDEQDYEENNNVKRLSIHLDNSNSNSKNVNEIINISENFIHEINVLNDNKDDDNEDRDDDTDDDESVDSTSTKYVNILDNSLDNSSTLDNNGENELINESNSSDIFKNLNISTLNIGEEILDKNNYKNLSIQKLRSIIVQKGLSSDASKLKKNDILKMLESESE